MSKQILIKEIKKIDPNCKRLQEKSKEEITDIYKQLVANSPPIDESERHKITTKDEAFNNQTLDELTEEEVEEKEEVEEEEEVKEDKIDDEEGGKEEEYEEEDDEEDDEEEDMTEYNKYLSEKYNTVKPNVRDIQNKLKKNLEKFNKTINKMIDLYCDDNDMSEEDISSFLEYYNEEFDFIDDTYQSEMAVLESFDMYFTPTFKNYYKKMMFHIERNIEDALNAFDEY
jgi:hypothetical protein